jgi:hypothetical protein
MAKGTFGVDTFPSASAALLTTAQALFADPKFWGRYFKSPGSTAPAVYKPAVENVFLHAKNIRVLPIAQQTNNVGSTNPTVADTDAKANCGAIIEAFGADHLASQGDEFLVFLDVEGAGASHLSKEYWTKWSATLVSESKSASGNRFTFNPCVYGRKDDNTTWTALSDACQAGAQCGGVWIFREHLNACSNGFIDWEPAFLTPTVQLPCEILLWQFAEDCPGSTGVDADQTNPNLGPATLILDRLILPPNSSP